MQLANDYAIKSKAKATWESYVAWFRCFEAFCDSFGVSVAFADAQWRLYAEVLRRSVALLSLCYSMSTIEIYVTAVCVMLKLRGVTSPRASETLRMTLEGVARELGRSKSKKPPVEPQHVAAILERARFMGWESTRLTFKGPPTCPSGPPEDALS